MNKVLVTGASGFIGRELTKALLKNKDYEVHTLERYVARKYVADENKEAIVHYANLTDYSAIKAIVKELQAEYVIHLGALAPMSFSFEHYIEASEVDYIGTVNLAEACYREVPNFKQFIFAGTSEEYGKSLTEEEANKGVRVKEDESVLKPTAPYSVAKVASDLYLHYMWMAYHFPYTIIRPFNTYGRKGNENYFIERTVRQMVMGDEVKLGDPTAIRDWVYIDDHVGGYIAALGNKKAIGQTFNICTGKGYSTKETAEIIGKLTKFKGEIQWNTGVRRPAEAKALIGDNTKAYQLLGWKPKYTLEEGVKKMLSERNETLSQKDLPSQA